MKPKEPQYQVQFDEYGRRGPIELGPATSHMWRHDPRHVSFVLARYKVVAKLLAGKDFVLEVGCGDGFGLNLVLQEVNRIHAIDFDPLFIKEAKKQEYDQYVLTFSVIDITKDRPARLFDAVYSLDVLEHIQPYTEKAFMRHMCQSLLEPGICIIGTPNVTAQRYASACSKKGHVNYKSASELRRLMEAYFHSVFIFGMNDEVLHLGYQPMAHYLIGMGVGVK